MKFPSRSADKVLMGDVGRRLCEQRLAQDLSQEQLAEKAGVSLRTLQRLETSSGATHLDTFMRVCHSLGLLENLDLALPSPEISRKRAPRRPRQIISAR